MAKKYALGLKDIRFKLSTPSAATATEVDTLTFSSAATSSGSIKIILDGVEYTVAVTLGDSALDIASAVRLESFTGWAVTGTDEDVIFTADDAGYKDAPKYLSGGTGVDATFVQTTIGEGFVFGVERSIGEVAEGSTQFVQEAPTETKFKGDYSDITLMTLFQMGDISIETDIIEVNAAKMAELTGATYNPSTKKVSLPKDAPIVNGEAKLLFDNGFEMIKIVNGQFVANLSGANMKTEMFKLHLKVVAVPDGGSFVEVVLN